MSTIDPTQHDQVHRQRRRSYRYFNYHLYNLLTQAILSGSFYLISSYNPSTSFSAYFYASISLATFTISLVLSDKDIILKLGGETLARDLYSIRNQRCFYLMVSQIWLMITLDLLTIYNNSLIYSPNCYFNFVLLLLAILTTASCSISVLI